MRDAEARVIADTYETQRLLGQGGMGCVYLARHRRTRGTCALKLLRSEHSVGEVAERFRREARVACALHHPHVVHVFDCGEHEGTPYLVMEHLQGEDLESRLRREGRLALPALVTLVGQAAAALQAAHDAGIVHRDVKAENLFLLSQAGSADLFVKVMDFGISKVHSLWTQQTGAQVVLGTPRYIAPEIAAGRAAEADARVDQWALGVLAYRALSGAFPFDGDSPMDILAGVLYKEPLDLARRCPSLPVEVAAVIMRALRKDRTQRFASVTAFHAALRAAALGGGDARAAERRQVRRVALVLSAAWLVVALAGWRAGRGALVASEVRAAGRCAPLVVESSPRAGSATPIGARAPGAAPTQAGAASRSPRAAAACAARPALVAPRQEPALTARPTAGGAERETRARAATPPPDFLL